jgi:hypothetical protein
MMTQTQPPTFEFEMSDHDMGLSTKEAVAAIETVLATITTVTTIITTIAMAFMIATTIMKTTVLTLLVIFKGIGVLSDARATSRLLLVQNTSTESAEIVEIMHTVEIIWAEKIAEIVQAAELIARSAVITIITEIMSAEAVAAVMITTERTMLIIGRKPNSTTTSGCCSWALPTDKQSMRRLAIDGPTAGTAIVMIRHGTEDATDTEQELRDPYVVRE